MFLRMKCSINQSILCWQAEGWCFVVACREPMQRLRWNSLWALPDQQQEKRREDNVHRCDDNQKRNLWIYDIYYCYLSAFIIIHLSSSTRNLFELGLLGPIQSENKSKWFMWWIRCLFFSSCIIIMVRAS